jgi:hypothetical protein
VSYGAENLKCCSVVNVVDVKERDREKKPDTEKQQNKCTTKIIFNIYIYTTSIQLLTTI